MSSQEQLRIGTRGSRLASWQAEWVARRLESLGHAVAILEIATRGDVDMSDPIGSIGATGVFTKEIQRALLAGEIDVAVHSLKDLPTEPVGGLTLAAVPERESAADVIVGRSREQGAESGETKALGTEYGGRSTEYRAAKDSIFHSPCSSLPTGARVGTGSLRRQAQLRHVRPDLRIEDVRGNVDTRLRKLDEGQFDALVLAEAGLRRLGLAERVTEVLPHAVMMPAVGQGALAIECRADSAKSLAAVRALDDAATRAAVVAERAMLAHLRGGCLAPVGAWGRIDGGVLHLSAVVLSVDGVERLDASDQGAPTEAEALGRRVAESLLARGADSLIAASRLA